MSIGINNGTATFVHTTPIFTRSVYYYYYAAVNNDDDRNCDALVCVKYEILLVISSTYHFLTMTDDHCSLQTKVIKKAALGRENRTMPL